MNIGLYGGSFNPIHNGHVRLAKGVCDILDVERFLIMPTYVSPFKQGNIVTDGRHRLEMCRLAFCDDDRFEISDHEICMKDVSYTVNTLRYLYDAYKCDDIYMALGSDSLFSLTSWYKSDEILSMCTVVAAARNEEDRQSIARFSETMPEGSRVIIADIEPFDVSSTFVRNRLSENCGTDELEKLVPERVAEYIYSNGLYKN